MKHLIFWKERGKSNRSSKMLMNFYFFIILTATNVLLLQLGQPLENDALHDIVPHLPHLPSAVLLQNVHITRLNFLNRCLINIKK